MARKYELSLRYFSHDTDMAYDRNVRKLTKKFGCGGYGVLMRLLECIYNESYYVIFSDDFIFDILDSINMDDGDECYIKDVVEYAVEIGLFDKDLYTKENVVTSHGIQVRYFMAKEASFKRSVIKNNTPDYPYLLVDLKELFTEQPKEPKVEEPKAVVSKPKKVEPKEETLFEETEDAQVVDDTEKQFYDWMKKNYPNVARMQKPLTMSEYNDLCAKHGCDILLIVLANLNNFKQINKKYIYAKQTLDNWCKSEKEKHHGYTTNQTTNLAEQLANLSRQRRGS